FLDCQFHGRWYQCRASDAWHDHLRRKRHRWPHETRHWHADVDRRQYLRWTDHEQRRHVVIEQREHLFRSARRERRHGGGQYFVHLQWPGDRDQWRHVDHHSGRKRDQQDE